MDNENQKQIHFFITRTRGQNYPLATGITPVICLKPEKQREREREKELTVKPYFSVQAWRIKWVKVTGFPLNCWCCSDLFVLWCGWIIELPIDAAKQVADSWCWIHLLFCLDATKKHWCLSDGLTFPFWGNILSTELCLFNTTGANRLCDAMLGENKYANPLLKVTP